MGRVPFFFVGMLALITATPAAAGGDAPAVLPDPYELMPDGPGKDEVHGVCGACHSMHLVIQQRQTREGWERLVRWMEKEQGMAPIDAELEGLILDYLSKHYAPAHGD